VSDPVAVRRGRNNKARGSTVERAVAKLLDGRRNPSSGLLGPADVETERFAIEVKSHKGSTPLLRQRAWIQAERAATMTGKAPLLIETYVDNGKRSFWAIQKIERDEDK